jgi:hypothetical protein
LASLCLLLAALLAASCDNTNSCKTAPECARLGKCSADDKGVCVVGSAEDCGGSDSCKLHGQCSFDHGACVARTAADCKSSSDCQKLATCDVYQAACVDLAKSVHTECTKTCESEGLCVLKDGKCSAVSRLHCAGTFEAKAEPESPCATQGLCTADSGRCAATSADDCAKSRVCKDDARCDPKDGKCIALPEDCKKSNACTNAGKCDAKDGKCVATSSADCRKSARCKLEGACSLKDGTCSAQSSADCQQSSVCAQAKHCLPKDGVCIGSGGKGEASSSPAPAKVGPSTITGIF